MKEEGTKNVTDKRKGRDISKKSSLWSGEPLGTLLSSF